MVSSHYSCFTHAHLCDIFGVGYKSVEPHGSLGGVRIDTVVLGHELLEAGKKERKGKERKGKERGGKSGKRRKEKEEEIDTISLHSCPKSPNTFPFGCKGFGRKKGGSWNTTTRI